MKKPKQKKPKQKKRLKKKKVAQPKLIIKIPKDKQERIINIIGFSIIATIIIGMIILTSVNSSLVQNDQKILKCLEENTQLFTIGEEIKSVPFWITRPKDVGGETQQFEQEELWINTIEELRNLTGC